MQQPQTDEWSLVQRCIEGDGDSWQALYQSYGPNLLGRLVRLLHRRGRPAPQNNEAEEILAQVFASLVETDFALLRSFRGESGLGTWLAVVATRAAQNYLRTEAREHARRTRAPEQAAKAESSGHRTGLEALEQDEALKLLSDLMAELRPRDQLILRLHFLEDLTYKEIAAIAGVSPNSVGPLISRATERIRNLLGQR